MSDVTKILSEFDSGDEYASDELLPLIYEELRALAAQRLAAELPGQTLQPTALVHEAYIRLVDQEQQQNWHSKGHFFAAAAEAMRRILVERARQKLSLKRGGDRKRVELHDAADEQRPAELLAIHEALEQLEQEDPTKAQLVKLRYFAGMSQVQAMEVLGISRPTASRYWTYAKAWLACALDDSRNT